MMEYTDTSMVKKEHVKVIASKLINLGSKIPGKLDKDKEHSLALLLSLACGSGEFRLKKDEILEIKDDTFSIEKSAIESLIEKSATRES